MTPRAANKSNLTQFEFEFEPITNRTSSKLKHGFELKRKVRVWFGAIQISSIWFVNSSKWGESKENRKSWMFQTEPNQFWTEPPDQFRTMPDQVRVRIQTNFEPNWFDSFHNKLQSSELIAIFVSSQTKPNHKLRAFLPIN